MSSSFACAEGFIEGGKWRRRGRGEQKEGLTTGLGSRCVSTARAFPRALWCGRRPIALTPCFLSSFSPSPSLPPPPPFPPPPPHSPSLSPSLSLSLCHFSSSFQLAGIFFPFGMFSVRLTSDKTLKTENRCRGGPERLWVHRSRKPRLALRALQAGSRAAFWVASLTLRLTGLLSLTRSGPSGSHLFKFLPYGMHFGDYSPFFFLFFFFFSCLKMTTLCHHKEGFLNGSKINLDTLYQMHVERKNKHI